MSDQTSSFVADDESLFKKDEHFHGYVVDRLLGKGGLGEVWMVRHEMLDTLFALKTLDPDMAEEQPEYVKRFLREAKIASKIRHPNLVAVHDAGYDSAKDIYYLVMDYVSGGTLRDAIAFGGIRSEKDAVQIVLQVASALAAARRFGLVHRDIKPENIMLTPEGVAKLVDLGVAKVSDGYDSIRTTTRSVFGTPAYISPEQALDSSKVDTRADIYSLGIVLFEMLCGRRPYDGPTPNEVIQKLLDPTPVPDVRSINGNISPKLSAVIQMMCAKRVEKRLDSPEKLIETLERIGYVLTGAPRAEFAAAPEVEAPPVVLPAESNAATSHTLTFETQDVEIKEFVDQLKRKRRKQFLAKVLVALGLIVGAVAIAVAYVLWNAK